MSKEIHTSTGKVVVNSPLPDFKTGVSYTFLYTQPINDPENSLRRIAYKSRIAYSEEAVIEFCDNRIININRRTYRGKKPEDSVRTVRRFAGVMDIKIEGGDEKDRWLRAKFSHNLPDVISNEIIDFIEDVLGI